MRKRFLLTDLDKCFKVELRPNPCVYFSIMPMIQWIEENCKHDWTSYAPNYHINHTIEFYFVDENDAMMFKLSL
jgi:hypothetical protein